MSHKHLQLLLPLCCKILTNNALQPSFPTEHWRAWPCRKQYLKIGSPLHVRYQEHHSLRNTACILSMQHSDRSHWNVRLQEHNQCEILGVYCYLFICFWRRQNWMLSAWNEVKASYLSMCSKQFLMPVIGLLCTGKKWINKVQNSYRSSIFSMHKKKKNNKKLYI